MADDETIVIRVNAAQGEAALAALGAAGIKAALVAPMVGFAVVERWSITATGWMCAAMILGATLLLVPEVKHGGLVRRATPNTPPLPADEGGS